MQNHDSHEFDAEFMDNSWEKMRQQLDVELPQKRKRRGGLLWWWTGVAAGILIGIAVMWWLMQNDGTNLSNFPIQSQGESLQETTKIDVISPPPTKDAEIAKDNYNSTVKKAEVTQLPSTKKSTPYQRISPNSRPDFTKSMTKTNTIIPSQKGEQMADNKVVKLESSTSEMLEQTQVAVEKELTINTVNTTDAMDVSHEKISNFPFLHIRTLESLNVSASDVALPIFPIRQRNRLRFGVQAAMSMNQEFAELGYAVGLGADWQFTPRWSVDVALQYASRPLVDLNVVVNSEAVLIEEVMDGEEPEDTGIDTESTNIDEVITTSIDTTYVVAATNNRFNFLELPLALQFHLHPRWLVGIGGRIAYRLPELSLGQREDTLVVDGQGGFSNQYDGEFFDSSKYTYVNNSYSLPDLARWRLSPTIAIQYQMSPNWQIRGQYSQTQWLMSSDASFLEQMDIRAAAENLIDLPRRTHEFQLLLRYRF